MIAMFDIFTLLYEEAKELISKWFYRFPKGKRKNKGLGRYFTPSPNGKNAPPRTLNHAPKEGIFDKYDELGI